MIIDTKNNLVFIACPKTGTTSIEKTLVKNKFIGRLYGVPKLKHLKLKNFLKISPHLGLGLLRTWSIIRHPRDKFVSWYKYKLSRSKKQKLDINPDFDQFIENLPDGFLKRCDDRTHVFAENLYCDIIFKYEDYAEINLFINQLYPQIAELPILNSSGDMEVSPDQINKIDRLLEEPIDWYNTFKSDNANEALDRLKIF